MNRFHSSSRRRFVASGLALAASGALPLAHAQGHSAQNARSLRIGYQKGLLSILKGRGTLEHRLAPLGVSVQWTEFPSGPPQLEALNVGSIDFGDVGEAPPVFAQAAGAPFVYYGQTAQRPASEALVVPDDSPVKSVAQLKGKRIALTKGSNTHFLLLRLLENANIDYADVTPVWLSPADARAAFEQKAVDAWAIWDPFLAVVQATGRARIIADGTGVVQNRAFYFTSRNYVAKNDDVLRAVLEEIGATDHWISTNREQAAAEFSRLWGIPQPIVITALTRLKYGTEPVSRDALANQQRIADAFYKLKLLPSQIDVTVAAPRGLA
ncbi:ABC transporter, substrate-binding protein, aliphatic sulfonates [Caballeronia sordidicola]|uniref:Putative aliphatic sulfonates-binding protein n=1 Tax=Caballeronia sordidicola TaxID=196367 RepID=A0A158H970_CABSO|nr:sulfonate ABC transporter substrate-binding protein [Caballeronia sordidicola]SAL40543.1 ABC transporter, substrate-binding protein, aliphatic sulfonates [Caballeronia sordidicola]